MSEEKRAITFSALNIPEDLWERAMEKVKKHPGWPSIILDDLKDEISFGSWEDDDE